jgi:hypothetical protein
LLILFVVLGSFSWVVPGSAQDVPADEPTATATATEQVEPTAEPPTAEPPTAEPTATETTAPDPTGEPAATETTAPAEPTATSTSTATAEPTAAEDDFSASAPIDGFQVTFEQCIDSARAGTTDFFFSGDFSAAALATDCVPVGPTFNGSQLVVSLQSDTQAYTADVDSSGNAFFGSEVEEGTYNVFIGAGEDYMAAMQGQITLEPSSFTSLSIVNYIAGDPPVGPLEEGFGSVSGQFFFCLDPERVGQLDVLIAGQFAAAAEASECQNPQDGQAVLRLSGDDVNGRTFSQDVNICCGTFSFSNVPYGGSYTLTDLNTGAVSPAFPVGGTEGGDLSLTVYSFYAEAGEPPLLPSVTAEKVICADDERVGTTEFVITRQDEGDSLPGFSAAATCYVVDTFFDPIRLTLTSGDFTLSQDVFSTFTSVTFSLLQPGTYTLTESSVDYEAESDPFELAFGDDVHIQVVNYVTEGDLGEPDPEGFPFTFIDGSLRYCTSPDRAGEADFLVQVDEGFELEAAGTSECRFADASEGLITVYFYGPGAEPAAEPVALHPARTDDGGFALPFVLFGWYQVAYSDGSFDEEFRSEIFPVDATFFLGGGATIDILAYVAPPAEAGSDVNVRKHICFDPARDGETDFFINQQPETETGGLPPVSAAATTECAPGTAVSGEYVFILTNTETGETAQTSAYFNGFMFGISTGIFRNVPPGTYTLTEQAFGGGEVVYQATSEPFTIAAGVPFYEIVVKNYTGDEAPEEFPDETTQFFLDAFTCINPARVGEFDYFYQALNPGPPPALSASATEECRISEPGEYAFELEGPLAEENEVAAQAVYPLVPSTASPYQFEYDSTAGGPLPAGIYVIRETVTGSVSEPVELNGSGYSAEFYFYQAEPTPTPTETTEPTATNTPDPDATATATTDPGEPTATATTDPVEPTATPTEDPGSGSGTVEPDDEIDSDGDGIPDIEDPDDDNDGIPDGQDPDDDNDGVPDDRDAVNRLPSTGQGAIDSTTSGLLIVLIAAAIALFGAALRTGRRQRG